MLGIANKGRSNQVVVLLYKHAKTFINLNSLNGRRKTTTAKISGDKVYNELLKEFKVETEQLCKVYESYLKNIELGLKNNTRDKSDIKCFQTYVQDLPKGDEIGKFLALDLGGTNFRVLMLQFTENKFTQVSDAFVLSQEILVGTANQLFDFIAECLAGFVEKHDLKNQVLPLGFTFSFPCMQTGLKQAVLRRWTKGFKVSGVEGEDVGRLLNEAIARRKDLKINCSAILNDTTGTLLACAHKHPTCKMGVIVGTGSNICYVECVSNVDIKQEYAKKPIMLINTECGAFGDSGSLDFIRTEYDHAVDALTPNAGTQIFEKMISGMYLGELVRLFLINAICKNLIFENSKYRAKCLDKLTNKINCFETSFISEIEKDTNEFVHIKKILGDNFGFKEFAVEDCEKLKKLCELISKRSAALISTAISVLINKMNYPEVVVGVDGSVYKFHPKYDSYMRKTLDHFVNANIKYDIKLSEDGSGRGAALVAAVVSKS